MEILRHKTAEIVHLSMFFPRDGGEGRRQEYSRELESFENFGSNSLPINLNCVKIP